MDLTTLPPVMQQRGGDPSAVKDELLDTIRRGITNHPRSLQKKIGPSEVGNPCDRRIGYKLLGVDEINVRASWRPTVGTAVHAWLQETFDIENVNLTAAGGPDGGEVIRWVTEQKVLPAVDLSGSCDLYDQVTATVIDWKVCSATTIKEARGVGPTITYQRQAHLYGKGWANAGFDVDTVGIYYLPSTGELEDGYFWHAPYDQQVADDALARLAQHRALTAQFGTKALPIMPTDGAEPRMCRFCPFYLPASTDLAVACPGAAKKTAANAA